MEFFFFRLDVKIIHASYDRKSSTANVMEESVSFATPNNLRAIQPPCDFNRTDFFFVVELEFLLTRIKTKLKPKIFDVEINIVPIVLEVC